MHIMLANRDRAQIFEKVANDSLCMENVNFLKAVAAFKQQSEALLARHSSNANNDMIVLADNIIRQHISSASDEEVNICSRTKLALTGKRGEWVSDIPFISTEKAREILQADKYRRLELFDTAHKEISIMLYQNLWNKFRSVETTVQMAASSTAQVKDTIYRPETKF